MTAALATAHVHFRGDARFPPAEILPEGIEVDDLPVNQLADTVG